MRYRSSIVSVLGILLLANASFAQEPGLDPPVMPATPAEGAPRPKTEAPGPEEAAPAPAAPQYPAPYEAPPEGEREREANNSIYVEGLGPGLLYSVNYERILGDFALRGGFGYVSLGASVNDGMGSGGSSRASLITVPLTATYIGIGSKKHIFELGGGITVVHVGAGVDTFATDESKSASASATEFLGHFVFGYRLQPPEGGFMLRTGISPIFGGGVVIPLPYIALGGTF